MSKYLVLFTPEAVDEGDQFEGKLTKMLFGYPDPKDAWQFDSAKEAHDEAVANDYVPDRDFIVVRVLASRKAKA